MPVSITEFISAKSIISLLEKLLSLRGARHAELQKVGKIFGDPVELAKYYVQPYCQHVNPADENEDDPISVVTSPVFDTINNFLNRDFAHRGDGRSQMFVLADAGMGKTSLLMVLKLSHLTSFWPKNYKCELLKLGKDTLNHIQEIQEPANTVLLF